ncbi:glutamine synthetase family protein [Phreatobacter cathodiphilus]|uniref:Glutamine synthetase n=1 Tax=Phreatobacter cathodiphilus TaxID=1868589 RepID=A0A2S0NGQ3_9HYPH|nr:glutamine synthetase family protein [Phreatobacter cathodiphilus]AVO47091.1 glutamine synthetase [Phreatobacter cathodiphilus]
MPPVEPAALVTLVTTDYSGITRGRSIAAEAFAKATPANVGWVPANQSLTPFDVIAAESPWGSEGDLRLLADPEARYAAHLPGAATALDMVMSDIVEFDGTPWAACPRSQLKAVLAELTSQTGLTLAGAFEHEFQVMDAPLRPAPAFSLQALRRADPFGPVIVAALAAAGLRPETFIPEYGRDQFEVTVSPATGAAIADEAVALREIVREAAGLAGYRVSFAPKTDPSGVGNGVHIHLSLLDAAGRNVLYDGDRPHTLSEIGAAFAAGIIRHLPALVAITAPSVSSYLRLKPHNWSSSYTWFGDQDREASLRICRTPALGGKDPSRGFNLEFRAADAAACPHLALAMIVRAGLQGVRERLPAPVVFAGDPEGLPPDERARLGLRRLPESLEAALAALTDDPIASSFFSRAGLATYLGMKRQEIALVADLDAAAMCRRYAGVY